MPSKQGNGRNKVDIKKLCIYALLTAVCLVFGYIESLVPLSAIAPGIKLGLSNALTVILLFSGDTKGAFAVNFVRISLSALLFGSPLSFAFSLCGGMVSLTVAALLKKSGIFSMVGISIVSGVVHNLAQSVIALLLLGVGMLYYLPMLIIGGGISGALIGILCKLILKKVKTNGKI